MEDLKDISTRDSKCPSCGGKLVFDPVEQHLKCSFCGNSYSPEKFELLQLLPEIDNGEADETEDDKCEIVCDNCGAVLITDKNTSATACSFCGSPAIISRRLSKQFRPEHIIPFKVTREEAEQKIIEFAKSKKYVPKDYFNKRNLMSVRGIYVPFWIMSSRCKVSTRGEGIKLKALYKGKYRLFSDFDVKYNNVPFDGSLEIGDALMEAIEPFDVSQRKPFNTSYLQGFYAQKFNLTTDNLCDRILYRMEQYGKETAELSFNDYDKIKFGACAARPYDLEHTYDLYPVWFLNFRYGDQNYMCAVNGQTGKTDGYLPVDKTKRRLRLIRHRIVDVLLIILGLAIFAGFLAALFFAGMAFMNSGMGLAFLIGLVILASPIGILCIGGYVFKFNIKDKIEPIANLMTKPFVAVATKRRDSYMKLRNETNMIVGTRPPAEVYYDSRAKIDFNNSEYISDSDMQA